MDWHVRRSNSLGRNTTDRALRCVVHAYQREPHGLNSNTNAKERARDDTGAPRMANKCAQRPWLERSNEGNGHVPDDRAAMVPAAAVKVLTNAMTKSRVQRRVRLTGRRGTRTGRRQCVTTQVGTTAVERGNTHCLGCLRWVAHENRKTIPRLIIGSGLPCHWPAPMSGVQAATPVVRR